MHVQYLGRTRCVLVAAFLLIKAVVNIDLFYIIVIDLYLLFHHVSRLMNYTCTVR